VINPDDEQATYNGKTFYYGQEIFVKAWWQNGHPVICRISRFYETFIEVRPLEGNPHARHVNIKDIL